LTGSIERQLDLFSVDRIGVEPVGRPVQPRRMAFELLDAELIAALPGADLATASSLAAEAACRHLAGAVPALERLCRRLTGFGAARVVPEQAASLQAIAAIGGKEARLAVARLLVERVVQSPTLAIALRAASRLGVSLPPPCLAELLRNARPEVRAAACRCIRLAPTHSELLVELLGDLHPEVATSTAIALGRTGRIEGLPMLTSLLLREPSAELIDAVAPIADEKVIITLGRRIARVTPSLRQAVLDALEQIGSPRAAMVAEGLRARDAAPKHGEPR